MSDPFKQPSGAGSYPKMEELEGHFVLLRPTKVETVPNFKKTGTVDRYTADVTVFGPEGTEFYDDMYLSQAGIAGECKRVMKPGSGREYAAGVVTAVPTKDSVDKGIKTPEELSAALAEWARKGGKGEKPQFTWALTEFTDAQAQQAREWIESRQRATDPFDVPGQ